MASKQKVKGSSYERQISKDLTTLYNQTFLRIPTSGAFTGGKNFHRTDTMDQAQITSRRGDIQPPAEWINFNCECKSYADLSFHQLIQQDCPQLDKWIEQTLDVARHDDVNIIFIKITRKGSYVCVENYPELDTSNSLQYKTNWFIFEYQNFFHQNKYSFENACKREFRLD